MTPYGKMISRVPTILLAALLALGAALAQQPDHPDISNFLRLNTQICTGGQPSLDDLARLKSEGVKAVLNLRRPNEYDAAAEAAKAKDLGLHYFDIPVSTADPKSEQVDEFLKILADPTNRPVFIHCHTANRVGAFWMIRRVLVDGWKVEDAEREAQKIGMHSENLRQFALDYIRQHSKKP
jgi:uncharacterized protein (TIGR01244 family)